MHTGTLGPVESRNEGPTLKTSGFVSLHIEFEIPYSLIIRSSRMLLPMLISLCGGQNMALQRHPHPNPRSL